MQDWCIPIQQAYTLQVLQRMEFWTKPSVYTQELLIHDGGKRERTERIHASFVNLLRVLVLAFQLEGEIVCKMTALMVPP